MVMSMEDYIKKIDLQTISGGSLAYIGDSVYDLYIRTYLASKSNEKSRKLHKKAISYVSAKAQSKIIDKIFEVLTDDEKAVYKRGRNTNIVTNKHVDIIEYKKATGFEALVGYMYISGNVKRIEQIIKLAIECVEENYG